MSSTIGNIKRRNGNSEEAEPPNNQRDEMFIMISYLLIYQFASIMVSYFSFLTDPSKLTFRIQGKKIYEEPQIS